MKHTGALLLAILASAPCAAAESAAPDSPAAKAAICSACHGPLGRSITPEWPSIAGQSAPYLKEQLELLRSETRYDATMSPMARTLNDADIQDLAKYFSEQTLPAKTTASQTSEPGKTIYEQGRAATATRACKDCHGSDGRGNPALMAPAVRAQKAAYIIKQLQSYADGTRYRTQDGTVRTSPDGAMEAVAKSLNEEDIRSVASHIEAMP
jgi:cytochrome c553